MILLAVDTSSDQGSLALAQENELLELIPLPPKRHSATLHGEIVHLLERHGLATRDIQGFGVVAGPGSFTGVRVGLAAVKGLAEVNEKPVVAVSSLETLAVAAYAQFSQHSPAIRNGRALAPILDARRGQVFATAYRSAAFGEADPLQEVECFHPLVKEMVCSLKSFLERMQEAGIEEPVFCGTELDHYGPEIEKTGWKLSPRIVVSPFLAASLLQIATERLRKGLGSSALDVDANYVRSSDAELFFKG